MSREDGTVGLEALVAYLDGELPPRRRREVERYLSDHPEEMERLAAWRRHDKALRLGFDELAANRPVDGLRAALHDRLPANRTWPPRWVLAAVVAVFVAAFASGGAVWLSRSVPNEATRLTHTAAAAYLAATAPHQAPESAAEHDRLMADISTHLGTPVAVADLGRFGFHFVSGQLLAGGTGPAVQLLYEDGEGRRLTCFYMRVDTDRETDFRSWEEGGVAGVYRLDDGLGWVVAGRLPAAELHEIARAVYAAAEVDEAER